MTVESCASLLVHTVFVRYNASMTDNATGAENQQERLSVDEIPGEIGAFLAGFALGEASFMLVCRPRADYRHKWKISAAFNVSQNDPTPLRIFQSVLHCGTMRRAGSGGWYFEVNSIADIHRKVIPFFERFPLLGTKQRDFDCFRAAVLILLKPSKSVEDYQAVLMLRDQMNRGGKRKHQSVRILRDYTPNTTPAIKL